MNNQAREKLREAITALGPAAFQTPRVLAFQVGQSLAEMPAERDILVAALNHGFVDKLRQAHTPLDDLAAQLKKKAGTSTEEARWALEAWADAGSAARTKSDNFALGSPWSQTKGVSYRPPTAEQFARTGIIAGILAGVLVGAFWGGVKAVSLGRPIHRYSHAYSSGPMITYGHNYDDDYGHRYYHPRRSVDIEFTSQSLMAWGGWIVAGGLIGCVAGGLAALYMGVGTLRFVGGFSGAIVGAIAGYSTCHRLFLVRPAGSGEFSDILAQSLVSIAVGTGIGILLGGFRDLVVNLRSDTPSPIFRFLFRLNLS